MTIVHLPVERTFIYCFPLPQKNDDTNRQTKILHTCFCNHLYLTSLIRWNASFVSILAYRKTINILFPGRFLKSCFCISSLLYNDPNRNCDLFQFTQVGIDQGSAFECLWHLFCDITFHLIGIVPAMQQTKASEVSMLFTIVAHFKGRERGWKVTWSWKCSPTFS